MELLECLKMSTESLIAHYYQERYDEQIDKILPCKAQLYVRVRQKTMQIMNCQDILVQS